MFFFFIKLVPLIDFVVVSLGPCYFFKVVVAVVTIINYANNMEKVLL